MMPSISNERCQACEGGVPPLTSAEAVGLRAELHPNWKLSEDIQTIARSLVFPDFAAAMRFLNRLAEIAEGEGHHPDFCLTGWNRVTVTLSTHAIGGLSRNDFIVAAKLDQVLRDTAA